VFALDQKVGQQRRTCSANKEILSGKPITPLARPSNSFDEIASSRWLKLAHWKGQSGSNNVCFGA
jgi:hypothetical protein